MLGSRCSGLEMFLTVAEAWALRCLSPGPFDEIVESFGVPWTSAKSAPVASAMYGPAPAGIEFEPLVGG